MILCAEVLSIAIILLLSKRRRRSKGRSSNNIGRSTCYGIDTFEINKKKCCDLFGAVGFEDLK